MGLSLLLKMGNLTLRVTSEFHHLPGDLIQLHTPTLPPLFNQQFIQSLIMRIPDQLSSHADPYSDN